MLDLRVGIDIFALCTPQVVMNASPYLTFGQVAANSAILEAFTGEDRVHIVDFGYGMGQQWPALIQALAARPGGPPHVRLTAIEPPKGDPHLEPALCLERSGLGLKVRSPPHCYTPPRALLSGNLLLCEPPEG